jgi:hypothetical protein
MKFYTTKYDYITCWNMNKDEQHDLIPRGTVMKVVAMDTAGLLLEPISKDVGFSSSMSFTPEMLKLGFTESEYID